MESSPERIVNESQMILNRRGTSSLNETIQYADPNIRKMTTRNTSLEWGDLPMPVITYGALTGVPRWASAIISPKITRPGGTDR